MAKIQQIIKDVTGDEEKAQRTRDALTLLADYSTEKAKNLIQEQNTYLRTAGTTENKTLPVTSVLANYSEVRVSTKEEVSDIASKVKDGIKKIVSGGIIDGVADLIGDALGVMLGSASGNEHQKSQYYVAVEGLSMVRYDTCMWTRSITVKSLMEYAEKSIIVVMNKSSLDVKKLEFNEFLNVYQLLLEKGEMTHDDLMQRLKEAEEVYKKFVPTANINVSEILRRGEARGIKENLGEYLTTMSRVSNPKEPWPPISE